MSSLVFIDVKMDEHTISPINTKEDVKRFSFKKVPFSALERELIEALVRARPIIENKRIHATNILLKRQAWEDLAEAFNSQPYVSRRKPLQLKRCWENMKSQRKKERSYESSSKSTKQIVNTPISGKKLESESDAIKKRCSMNIQHDQALHELRIEREKILIEREKNMLEFEKERHKLEIEKLKLEINKLKNN